MKRITLLCMAMLLITATAMAAGGKVAYVDSQSVFDKTKLGKKYQGVVREYYESRKKILDLDSEEIQKLQDDYTKQKQAKLLNEKAQKEKEETLGRKCICNALPATVGLQQVRAGGVDERAIVTAGDDLALLAHFLSAGRDSYSAADVIDLLLASSR